MSKSILLLLFILICVQFSAKAQGINSTNAINTEKEVKQVIENMFFAMKQSDTLLLKNCFSETVIFQTILNQPEGVVIKTESVQNFMNSIGKQLPTNLDERIEFGPINVEPLMATVWTPYSFYYKGQYSHKGVNSFQLVKLKEGWKIQYLIDTRYK